MEKRHINNVSFECRREGESFTDYTIGRLIRLWLSWTIHVCNSLLGANRKDDSFIGLCIAWWLLGHWVKDTEKDIDLGQVTADVTITDESKQDVLDFETYLKLDF